MKRISTAGLIILICGLFAGAQPAAAQISVTPQQMQMFNSLSDAQKAQILQQLGGSAGAGPVPGAAAGPALPDLADAFSLDGALPEGESVEEDGELRISGGDTIVVKTSFKDDVDPIEIAKFMADPNRSRFVGTFLRRLDKRGQLILPGIAAIALAGLTADEVEIRLSSEPLLQSLDPLIPALDIEVTILPVEPAGRAGLKPFGYELFGESETVSPFSQVGLFGELASLPIPRDYVLGPGDTLHVQLYGAENFTTELIVNRDGTINFPKIGPKVVSGLTFGEVKEDIEQRIDEQLIGTEAAVTMGILRTIQVFVVGDVKRPGVYQLSSLSRITSALGRAGGITEIGSMRKVTLNREGKRVATLDLYDLLLRGDARNDAQLRTNDVVLVPPAGRQAGIDGEIRRPALYELVSEKTAGELIDLAGGLLPTADATSVQLERVSQSGVRSIETFSVLDESSRKFVLQSGDYMSVLPVLEDWEDSVFLEGHTARPGSYEWKPGMRLLDLFPSSQYLLPKADLGYVLIRREQGEDRQAVILSADLEEARRAPSSSANLPLQGA